MRPSRAPRCRTVPWRRVSPLPLWTCSTPASASVGTQVRQVVGGPPASAPLEGGSRGQVAGAASIVPHGRCHLLVPEAERSAESMARGKQWPAPQRRGEDRKKGCGAPKRKLRRPLLPWGEEAPPPPPTTITTEGQPLSAQRSLLEHFGFLFHSQRSGWGISSRSPPRLLGLSAGARDGLPRGPTLGCGSFLPRKPLLPPSRVGTRCALAEPAFDSSYPKNATY